VLAAGVRRAADGVTANVVTAQLGTVLRSGTWVCWTARSP
jgi:hypothetical protein